MLKKILSTFYFFNQNKILTKNINLTYTVPKTLIYRSLVEIIFQFAENGNLEIKNLSRPLYRSMSKSKIELYYESNG